MCNVLSFTAKLEQSQLGLNQTINELSQNLKEQGATFRAQVWERRPLSGLRYVRGGHFQG
jgi:hypothetical protein